MKLPRNTVVCSMSVWTHYLSTTHHVLQGVSGRRLVFKPFSIRLPFWKTSAIFAICIFAFAAPLCCSLSPHLAFANEVQHLTFDGNSLSASASIEGLFDSFGAILPGETRTGTVTLFNGGTESCIFYLRVAQEPTTNRSDAAEAPMRMKLSIQADGQSVYEGDLRGMTLKEGTMLGQAAAGEAVEVSFVIEAPSDMENEFVLSSICVPWVFAAQQIAISTSSSSGKQGSYKSATLAQTGNETAAVVLTVFASVAAAAGATTLVAHRKNQVLRSTRKEIRYAAKHF